jgi:hypothetical protein
VREAWYFDPKSPKHLLHHRPPPRPGQAWRRATEPPPNGDLQHRPLHHADLLLVNYSGASNEDLGDLKLFFSNLICCCSDPVSFLLSLLPLL